MIALVRSDRGLTFVAVITVVALVLLSRHGRTWWHRHTGRHHPARTGRLVMAGAALLGLGALTVGMALGGDPGGRHEARGERVGDGHEAVAELLHEGVPGHADALG